MEEAMPRMVPIKPSERLMVMTRSFMVAPRKKDCLQLMIVCLRCRGTL
jgi:hypothetical protein